MSSNEYIEEYNKKQDFIESLEGKGEDLSKQIKGKIETKSEITKDEFKDLKTFILVIEYISNRIRRTSNIKI